MPKLYVVLLWGGDSDKLDRRYTTWVDLDRERNAWAVLTTRDHAEQVAQDCGAELLSCTVWDGRPFGDGNIGSVVLRGNKLVYPGSFTPTYVPRGLVAISTYETED